MRTVAALFVDPKGVYSTMPGVELWDEERDARTYAGPHPVVAHPPCSRWCRLAGLVEARWGHKRGEDGGCFAAALEAVRRWGGVLEHPAYTDAFRAFGLGQPPRTGGWQREICGGFTCHVEQGRYGHPAKKATWLYACDVELPDLEWGASLDTESDALVSWCGNHVKKRRVEAARRQEGGKRNPSELRRRARFNGPHSEWVRGGDVMADRRLFRVRIAIREAKKKRGEPARPGFDMEIEFGAESFAEALDKLVSDARITCQAFDGEAEH